MFVLDYFFKIIFSKSAILDMALALHNI